MAASGGAQHSIRRAIGALKDTTTVGLAKVSSENKGLDVAIVKATNHDEALVKDKYIKTILTALSASSPRADVAYCIQGLNRRLARTRNWTVALKTLLVIHRALREVDTTFREELINYSQGRGIMPNLSHFRDDSSSNELLDCYRALKYDVVKDQPRSRGLDTPQLLKQLPAMQQLLFRLLACKPEGMAGNNILIQFALSVIASESVKLYVAITDGILNLIDKYFEMQRQDAIRALEIYKKADSQCGQLSEFFETCRAHNFGGEHFIKIQQINDDQDTGPVHPATEAGSSVDDKQEPDNHKSSDPCMTELDSAQNDQSEIQVKAQVTDLLEFDELTEEESKQNEKNSLALATLTSGEKDLLEWENGFDLTPETPSWELALITTPGSSGAAATDATLVCGIDRLTLDTLYEEGIARTMNHTDYIGQARCNPFESACFSQNPFHAYSNTVPPTDAAMAGLHQELAFPMMQPQQQQNQQLPIASHDSSTSGNPFF
ncbi:hypothetical protein Tsubulata_006217 [Turnera subulata]|uniref:ENTH domain-containing protein n=1 Tax=Turnera subulata TaxID=218843 RepID=A0A9Q0J9Z8_9ROSI|nr:hypothetical protein Tsubulata_006217 [Turnera subulata]